MSTESKSQFEKKRLSSLKALEILDTAPDKAFENLVELAAQIAGVRISLVSFVAEDRQWFKACLGLGVSETPRNQSFCSHAIENAEQPLIVCDARTDPRFANNPLVVGEPFIRFYAGFPIKSPVDAMPLGTLSVIDPQIRELDEKTIGLLTAVAKQAESLLELHHCISEHQKTQEENADQRARLNLALETGNVGLWDWDTTASKVYTSPTYKKQLGIPIEADASDPNDWLRRLNPKDKDEVLARRDAYLSGDCDQFEMTYRLRHNDGFYRWIFSRGKAEFDSTGKPLRMLGVHIDVTERQEAEKAVVFSRQMAEESERENRLLSAAIKNSKDAFLIASVEGNVALPKIVFVNDAFSQMTGYQIEELGQADFKTFLNGQETDGTSIELTNAQIRHWQVVRKDILVYKKNGSSFWANVRMTPIANGENVFTHWLIFYRDIDEQKQIEAKLELERHLLKESNADLDQFAYAASHDLQEPLRAVGGFLQLLETKYADQLDEQARGYIQKSVAGASRMSQLINDLLLFSHVSRSPEGFVEVDLNEVVVEARRDHEQIFETSQARIDAAPLPTIFGARPLLIQLFRNLIGNSIKYRSEGSPRIEISSSVDDKICTIRFQDNGIGIEDKYRHQVFELFKRLHRREEHSGTGIGLAICKRVVLRHGGSIEVEPNGRPGTCLMIRLPINESGL